MARGVVTAAVSRIGASLAWPMPFAKPSHGLPSSALICALARQP